MRKNKFILALLLATLGLIPFFFGSRVLIVGFTQIKDQKEKQITRPSEKNEPFEVVDVKLDQKKVDFGSAFKQDGDWLKNFAVTYKNKTGKKIVSASFYLTFPETRSTGNVMSYGLSFGTPRLAAMDGERTVVVEPDENISLVIDDKEFKKLKAFVERRQLLDTLTKAELTISFILFDDGTAWAGQYRIQDPNRPGVWIVDPKRNGGEQ